MSARLVCYDANGNITFDSNNCVSSKYVNMITISGEGSFYDANIANADGVWVCPVTEATGAGVGLRIRPQITRSGGTIYYSAGKPAQSVNCGANVSSIIPTQTIMYGVF